MKTLFITLCILCFFGPLAGAEEAEPTKILIVGDSLSDGYGIQREEAYPYLLESRFNSSSSTKTKTRAVKFINAAESGSLSSSSETTLKFHLKRTRPKVVLIAIGGNDARAKRPVATIQSNIEKAIVLAKANDIKVILAGQRIFSNLGAEYASDFERIYKQLAAKHKITLIPFLLEGVAGVKTLNLADGFHPNKEGHKIIAETVFPYIKESL